EAGRDRSEAQPASPGRGRPHPGDDGGAAPDARRVRGSRRQARTHVARAGRRHGRHRGSVDAARGRVPTLSGPDRRMSGARVPASPRGVSMVLGLFKKKPKLEATFTPTIAVARELRKEVEVAGDLVIRNVGGDVQVTDLETVLVAGGTRRIDLDLPPTWRG